MAGGAELWTAIGAVTGSGCMRQPVIVEAAVECRMGRGGEEEEEGEREVGQRQELSRGS